MRLFAPRYYEEFKCRADACTHSCCVGWEIDVDESAVMRYSLLKGSYAERITESIAEAEDGTRSFRLDGEERCPHLDKRGLCNIIKEYGEGYLCDICREHPRFYNITAHGEEVGLGLVCEAAAEIILNSDAYGEMIEISPGEEKKPRGFDAVKRRERIYSVLSNRAIPYIERLLSLREEYRVSPDFLSDAQWRGLLSSLEYLDAESEKLFSLYSSSAAPSARYDEYLERALAYFIYRHVSMAKSTDEFRAALGFAFFCERLYASLLNDAGTVSSLGALEAARRISEELEYSEENTEKIKAVFAKA